MKHAKIGNRSTLFHAASVPCGANAKKGMVINMKTVAKKISFLIMLILCFSSICMIPCAAQPAPESKPVNEEFQSDIGSLAQITGSSESNSEDTTDVSDKSGTFSDIDPMNKENINKSLQIFGKGMVAIFAVIIIIIIVVMIVQKVIAALNAPPKDE